jgi:hypothetical protein
MRKSSVGIMSTQKSNWLAAAELGLISSSFSTIVSQLFAARLGRDAFVDWMTVAAIPMRDAALSAEPSWGAILAGIAFHQWADFSWAVVFFGMLGRWTAKLSPWRIFLLATPWQCFLPRRNGLCWCHCFPSSSHCSPSGSRTGSAF